MEYNNWLSTDIHKDACTHTDIHTHTWMCADTHEHALIVRYKHAQQTNMQQRRNTMCTRALKNTLPYTWTHHVYTLLQRAETHAHACALTFSFLTLLVPFPNITTV